MGTVNALMISADHPAYAGHFPGTPILPGVVLLDAALRAIERASNQPCARWQITAAKFQSPVGPGEALTLEHEQLPNGSIRFAIRTVGRAVANGVLIPSRRPQEPGDDEQA
jgi:3-hydroxymyristoyl/3-hydroxydecanoyl-(acyl carrier protein) dehydratase